MADAAGERIHPERSRGRRAVDRKDRRLDRLRRQGPLCRRLLPRFRAGQDHRAASAAATPRSTPTGSSFAVDPYYDKRTGYMFGVNPAEYDHGLGPVQRRQRRRLLGRRLGMRRPPSTATAGSWRCGSPSTRSASPRQDEYVWGVNFRRVIKRKNETASFAWVPKNEPAFVSQVRPAGGHRPGSAPGPTSRSCPTSPARASSGRRSRAIRSRRGTRSLGNAGFDFKVGLKGNLTLDATVNPDFGQVEVDPAVVNLSAYETFYEEKRPFFIEGASIFTGFGRGGVYLNAGMNWPDPRFFYSRRDRPGPAGIRDRARVRRLSRPLDDPGRGQAHRQARRLEHRLHQRPDRPRVRHGSTRLRRPAQTGGRAVLLLRRPPGPEGHQRGPAGLRIHGHGRHARTRPTRRLAGS